MRKYKILFILLLLLLANGWSQAQTIGMRVPDTMVVSGNNIDIPIYADSSLTGKNFISYMLQLTYNPSYFQPISVIIAGTISEAFVNPTFNTSVPGTITIAGAGSTPLSGKGKFITIRLKALKPGNINLTFTGTTDNFFNEGIPAMSFKNGLINITAPPSITVNPDNGVITKGEQLQFNVTGGASPFQWFVTNAAIATIDATGLLTGTEAGFTKVVAQDNNGLRDTTNQVEIRSMRLSIPSNLSQWQGADIDIPVNTTDLSGLNMISGFFTISFNQNILTPISVVQTGTLLASYPVPLINLSIPGNFSLAFAGSTPLTGSGTLVYIKFHVSAQNTGNTTINFVDGMFNENLLPTFTNGNFNTINLPVLTISPNTANVVAGETKQFSVSGGGIQPLTWSVNDTIATINQSGLITAKRGGIVKVTVIDSVGATASSGNIQIYDTRIIMPDTVTCPATSTYDYPVLIQSLPSGESVLSFQGTINYDTAFITFQDIETSGTHTQGWTFAKNQSGKEVIFAGSGSNSFNSAGTILKLRFTIKSNFTTGSNANITLNNVTLNEGIPLPLVDISGRITGANTVSAGTVSGTATVCQGQQGVAYSVTTISGATGYAWSLPAGATIATGSNTNSITVNYSGTAASGNITAYGTNGCGNGAVSPDFAVTVNPLPGVPGTITGQAIVCQGQNAVTYTVPSITNASSYIWTLPTGASGTSITNSITVNYSPTAISGNIVVGGNNSCGEGATSTMVITVNTIPASAGTISGLTAVCQGQNSVIYTVPAIIDATSYIWTLPTGASGTSTTNSITVDYSISAVSGNITVKGNNSCGDGATSMLAIIVNNAISGSAGTISGTSAVCQGQNAVTYTVPTIANAASYIWTIPTGATGTSLTNNITIDYGASAVSGNITVKGTNGCGDGTTSTLAISVNPIPASAGTISGITTVCQGQNAVIYTVSAIANATSYVWTMPSGATGTSSTNSITVNYGTSAVSGDITVKGTNACGDGATSTLAIAVNPVPASAGTISGNTTVCQGQNAVTYTVPAIANATSYVWTLPSGASGASTTNSITVDYSITAVSGNIVVKGNNSCGDGASSTLAITVNNSIATSAGTISGATTVCQGQNTVSYTVPTIANAVSYIWTIPTGATGTSLTNNITIDYGASAVSGNITVKGTNGCGDGTTSTLAITVNPIPASAGTISGITTVCQGQNAVIYTVSAIANATSYVWTMPSGATGTSSTNSITVNYGTSAVSSDITVKGTNACGDGETSTLAVAVNPVPASAGTISGNTTVCQGQNAVTYTVPAIANATSYVWTLPSGASGASTTNSITVDYSITAVSGNIVVKGNNSCGDGASSTLAITVNNSIATSAGTISGATTVCQGQNTVSYTVPTIANAVSYIWTIPTGATGTSLTNNINIDYGASAVSGNITVKGTNGCGDGTASTLAITVNPIPASAGTISGITTVCQGQNAVTYTVSAIANATSYVWTMPSGATGTSSTNSITVNYGTSAVSGDITVKGTNACGDGETSTLAVAVNPVPASAGTISGNTTVCQGQNAVTYTVPAIANATSYVWTLPSGASGTSITNNITVDYGASVVSGNIIVKGTNTCGDGATSTLAIALNPIPASAGTISGITTVCQGQNAVVYTVPAITNATSYIWTLPAGATGTSLTNNITIDYGASAVSGNITVKGQNSCGDGATSTLSITVNNKPATPVINLNGNVLHSNAATGNQWYNQSGIVNGAVNQNYTPVTNGTYYVIVTINGCSSDQSNSINITNVGFEFTMNNRIIHIYPNPISNELIIEYKGITDNSDFEVINILGHVVFKGRLSEKTIVETATFTPGIYFLKIKNGNSFEFRKIVKE